MKTVAMAGGRVATKCAAVFMHDLHTVQDAVRAGTTQDARQQSLYRQWANFCSTLSVGPTLQDSSLPRVEILQVYEHRVRHTHYSKLQVEQLGKESVSQAWGEIAATHLLDGLPDPRKPPDAQAHTGLDRHLARQLKTYSLEDPPTRQEKALPLSIVHSIVATASLSSNIRTRQVADLVTLGFYFCLRSCEYTKCTGHRRTVQFQPLMDFVFFVGDQIFPADALIEQFQHATEIVLTLDNQKNAIRGESVSYFRSSGGQHLPLHARTWVPGSHPRH